MPIYKYFGDPARYHGKPLFHILCNLKDFGKGRVVTRAAFESDAKPSFYRILFAQPLMDNKTEEGRAIVEKVRNGVRYTEPVDLSQIASLPDFKLIPRHMEDNFCKWNELRDYSPDKDYVVEPKYYTAPPLLRLLMERQMKERKENITDDRFLLPHFKTYEVKNKDTLEEREGKVEKYQETITRCEGTAQYQYCDVIKEEFRYGLKPEDEENISQVLETLPEEAPVPGPEVGMRLFKIPWSNLVDLKEEPRSVMEKN